MKRIISLLLVLVLALSLISCGTAAKETAASDQKTSDSAIKVDENIVTVDITLPASMFEGQDMTAFDTDTYVKENKFNKAVVNADGSITITMTKARHREILAEMQTTAEESYQKLVDDTDTPYVESIDHNKNFSTVTVSVDRVGYDDSVFDITPFAVWAQAAFYQAFTGEEVSCTVIMKYSDNGEVISSTIYPDAIEDAGVAE